MLLPRTYAGYDKDGKVLCKVTAVDANRYLNPDEVSAAIDKVVKTAEESVQNIIRAINNIEPDASEAVVVQGTKMTKTIEETSEMFKALPGIMEASVREYYEVVVAAHDKLQDDANTTAESGAWISGVVDVREW